MNRGYTLTATLRTALASSLLFTAEAGWSADAPAGGNGQPPYSWRGINGSGVFPAQDLVTKFWDIPEDYDPAVLGKGAALPAGAKVGSRKNIVWRTLLPHYGHNSPVVVGKRVFLLTNEGWKSDCPELVCLDAETGKILWQKPVDHMDAWPADKAAEGKKWRAKHLELWRRSMTWWNRIFYDGRNFKVLTQPRNTDLNLPPERLAILEEARKDGFDWAAWRGSWGVDITAGVRGRYYWTIPARSDPARNKEYTAVQERCGRERYYWHPGWSSEGPYFGSTMGSVVSDGQRVYAVTALDATACYDFDGNLLWVTDLEGKPCKGYPAATPYCHTLMQSPVLTDGMLVYFHRDEGVLYGLEARSGRIAWRTRAPASERKSASFNPFDGKAPINYEGHMGPGGTPVIMRLPVQGQTGRTTVVVTGHGMAARVADGKLLGIIQPRSAVSVAGETKDEEDGDDGKPGFAPYNSWVAADDVLYAHGGGRPLLALRLRLAGDALAWEEVWRNEETRPDSRNINLIVADGRVYGGNWLGKRGGFTALDAAIGKHIASGPTTGGYTVAVGFAGGQAVLPRTGMSNLGPHNGHGFQAYTVVSIPAMKELGTGLLVQEKPSGEVRERHAATMGTDTMNWGPPSVACWGNRIFIRSNDYLWCVGNPAEPFVPPEAVKP